MAQWKRILTADDVTNTNIGSTSLSITGGHSRFLTLGNSFSTFNIRNSTGSNTFLSDSRWSG